MQDIHNTTCNLNGKGYDASNYRAGYCGGCEPYWFSLVLIIFVGNIGVVKRIVV